MKSHPFFNGIDWAKVAERKSESPFEPNEFQIDNEESLNIREKHKMHLDDELDAAIAEELQGN